ncbi:MAG: Tyrosine recombinase XerD [Elusimicrobia bacterium ADurb.Bin231]|nr:MAG: Tyrosine recombinase XerD [Elusimicrobia bacterium ADurb.Bin231]
MPAFKRHKTGYPGVTYIEATGLKGKKVERVYYIRYRRNGVLIEEKVGRQSQGVMTDAKASQIRADRIRGIEKSNKEKRHEILLAKEEEKGRWTVSKLWEEYEKQKEDTKSFKIDKNWFENYLEEPFGDKEPQNIIQLDVDRQRIKLQKTLSPQSVKHILALLRRLVNFGVQKQLCNDLTFKIQLPEVHNNKTEDLTPEQLNNLLQAINNSQDHVAANMMRIALYTGMRRGEMFKLKWDDIDFHKGFISLRDPKGKEPQKIPLNDSAKSVFESIPKHKSGFVFTMNNGKPFTTDLRRRLNRIRDAAKIPKDFRALHGLRHVYASMLASSGQVDMYTLQKLLTHKSPLMTQRYAHLRDETLKNASALAGKIIEEAAKNGQNKIKTA